MPYDKGDFTQQGINGDVSALVRLNEKRVMKVVLSSDDESDNCDISGKIYDLLNGTSYDIGSGGGGGLEYETGTFNTGEVNNDLTINFNDIHNKSPFYVCVFDRNETNISGTNETVVYQILAYHDIFDATLINGANTYYRWISCLYPAGTTLSPLNVHIKSLTGGTTADLDYYLRPESFTYYSASRYLAGNTDYKWIAIWD